jgi:hypothetical protein
LCVLFFFSGFPALIYQLLWQRALFRIFGVNMESVTIVVTAFLLGLGFGSVVGGWLCRRREIPLLPLLAAIELLTGAFGMVSLSIFDHFGSLALGMPLALTAAAALGLVLAPTLLMGATLPLLVGHLVLESRSVGGSLGLLYYVNTLGAGAACLIAAVLLFPFLGMQGAVYVAVALNGTVAAGALAAHFYGSTAGLVDLPDAPPSDAAAERPLKFVPALGLACFGGFVSLSYELFFFRIISYATGSSASAFAATLGAFLIGLAGGSRVAGRLCETAPKKAVSRLPRDLIVANLVGLLFLPVLSHLVWLGTGVQGVALLMVYLFARGWAKLLPCIAHFGVAADDRAGMRTALIYLANIIGAACGALITGFLLMDRLNHVGIALFLLAIGLACALVLIVALPLSRSGKRVRAGGVLAIAGLAALSLPTLAANLLENLLWKGKSGAETPFASIVENRSGIITVDRSGTVFGNGAYDGRFNVDLVHDANGIFRPYALSLFHPAPTDVLMIGLSSGSWAQVIANNPTVATLTIVELNPGYLELIAGSPDVASLLSNPKVTVVIDDGRRWLHLNPQRKFDAIVSNTTWYYRAHTTNLLSSDFLAIIKDHLKAGGIFFYNTTDSARVQRTGCLMFAYGARFSNHMLLSTAPLSWDFVRWRAVLESYRIDGHSVLDLTRGEDQTVLNWLMALKGDLAASADPDRERQIEPCSEILIRTSGMKQVTDDNMGSEWRYIFGLE